MAKSFFVVATPIGNLSDMSFRAVETLKNVDIILCEDTRVTRKLLDYYEINTKTESYHAQASQSKEDAIIRRIEEGISFALVSDAGTPTISDPGVKLIAAIKEQLPDVVVVPVPGASALITALTATGFSGNQFTFYGFLPHKKGRTKIFDEIESSLRVSVFYESPHRLMKTLEECHNRFEVRRNIAVARELTKMYEEIPTGTATEIYEYYRDNPDKVRGECVVIIDK